ncbi:hypothetical protein Tco_1266635 [Tanacetum coccineum]
MKLPPSVSSADMFSGQIMVKCKRTRSTSSVMCKCKSGLTECKASTSNLRRIQVKDIVKEVEDYLKTYSSAGMDISSVDTIPTTNDTNTTTTTTNVAQNGVDENLPQLLDTRGGSHVTNIHAFDKEDFTSWKVRFLVFLDGLEPYLLNTLEDGPFVPMSNLSTSTNPLRKPQNQWAHAKAHLANQDKRLKSIIISCLPNDVMKAVIKCKTAKAMWNDLILAHEGPSDTRDTKIAALRLKFDTFKALDGEKASSSKALIFDNNFQDNDSDVEEDIRSSSEFISDLNTEYHERALLANQKRFYKRSGRVGSSRKPIDKSKEICFTCGKPGKYKGLKAEMAVLTKRIDDLTKGKSEKGKSDKGLIAESFEESVSSKDEGTTKIKAFMAIAEDEPSVGKANARSGQ